MDNTISNIKLILGNPANSFSQTSRDLLETMIITLELEQEKTFEQRNDDFVSEMRERIGNLIFHSGVESKSYSEKVLIPEDDFKFNIPNTHYNGYVVEVSGSNLICDHGHQYSYDVLEMEELCQLIDHLIKKYS